MNIQDHHNKNGSSGHENYVCHRCRWPFPNPHPSAKHRKAHKKLCGTIEGYKLIQSSSEHPHLAVSDDEHTSSDDDFHTPSSEIGMRNMKELDSGGGEVGEKSNKSEGEVFADAVMEFTDSGISPGIEEHIRELNKDVKSQLLKVNAIGVSSGPPNDPLETAAKSLNDTGVETSSVGSSGIIGLGFDDSPVKFETPTDATAKETNADVDRGIEKEPDIESAQIDFIDPQAKDVKELPKQESSLEEKGKETSYALPEADREREPELEANKGKSLDFGMLENVVHDSVTMGDEQISENLSTVKVVEQKKDENDESGANLPKNDGSPLVKPLEHISDSIAVLDHDIEQSRVSDVKEDNLSEAQKDNTHSFLVLDNVDHVIEDFKDYNILKSSFPLDLGSAEVIRLVQGDDEATIAEEGHSGLHSGNPSRSIESSSADLNALKHDLDEKGVEKPTDDEKDDISGLVEESGEDNRSRDISEGLYFHSIDSEPSKAHAEIARIEGDNADNSEKHIKAREESSKEPPEDELSANKKTIQEHADSFLTSDDNQTNGSLEVDGNDHHVRAIVELLGTARCESSKVGGSEILVTNTKVAKESSGQTPISTTSDMDMVPDKGVDARGKMEQAYPGLDRCADENSEASQGFGFGNFTDASKDIEVNHDGSLLASDGTPEDFLSKEVLPLPADYELLNNNSATVEVSHTKEDVKYSPDCVSELSRDEVNSKLGNERDGVSAIAISVASSSRADSLEALSAQSDATATADAGGLPFNDSQPPGKPEAYMPMPKHATDEYHRDKLDEFEPPSFMTLVHAGKVTTSDEHNKQQRKHEDLQAAWFPSLSNVVNKSQGRKKNEEIIAKVSNWSTGKQHAPVKTLLGEVAKSPNSKQVTVTRSDETATKSDDAAVTTVNAIPLSEAPNDQAINKEVKKEWNSPARYPTEIKKEKRKGRPYWVPFVCCSSVH